MEEQDSHRASNCNLGCRVPFLSFFTDLILGSGPEVMEKESDILFNKMCGDMLSPNQRIAAFESLADKFGVECIVFLPSLDASQPTGKKCVIRSRLGEGKAEIRLRTKGEMKKIRFQWSDIAKIENGRDIKLSAAITNISEAYELRFLHFALARRGTINLLFPSQEVRDSVIMAIRYLASSRPRDDESAYSSCGASETSCGGSESSDKP